MDTNLRKIEIARAYRMVHLKSYCDCDYLKPDRPLSVSKATANVMPLTVVVSGQIEVDLSDQSVCMQVQIHNLKQQKHS